MQIQQDGEWYESLPMTWVAGTQIVDLKFLEPAKNLSAPVVDMIMFRFLGSVSGVTGGHVGEDSFKIFSNISMVDQGGEYYSAAGAIARIDEQMELGAVQTDPANIASAATVTTYEFYLRIPFKLPRAERPTDTCMELSRLTDNGQVQITLGNPPVGVVNSGTVKMYVKIRDERNRELKSRLIRRMIAQNGAEYSYPVGVGGSLRKFILTSNLTAAAGYTALTGITAIDSVDLLRVRSIAPFVLREAYRASHPYGYSSGDEVIADNAIVLIDAKEDSKIGSFPSLKTVHLKTAAVTTGGVVFMHYIEDRSAAVSTNWLGLQSPAQLDERVRALGHINISGGGSANTKVVGGGWAPELQRRLPVKFKG